MARVVAIGEVEDVRSWEAGFRTHGDLFKSQSIISPIHFSAGQEGKQIAVLFEVRDLDTFMEVMESPPTAEAMAQDGFKRETLKLFVLDKQVQL